VVAGREVVHEEVLTQEGRREEEYQEEEAGPPPHQEGGEGGDRVEDRGTLELQAGEGEELHLAECSAWNRGRLVEESCKDQVEELSVDLALVLLFPSAAAREY